MFHSLIGPSIELRPSHRAPQRGSARGTAIARSLSLQGLRVALGLGALIAAWLLPVGDAVAPALGQPAVSNPTPRKPPVLVVPQQLVNRDPGDVLKLDNPAAEGWDTEAFNNLAGGQLKALGKLIAEPEAMDADRVGPLVAADFVCQPLRPKELSVAVADPSLTVRRASASHLKAASAAAMRSTAVLGPAAMIEAIKPLVEPYRQGSDIRSKFKIVRVDRSETTAFTTVLVQTSARLAGGSFQQSATWRITWRVRDDASVPPIMQAIEVLDHEEAQVQSAGGTLLADCTLAAIGRTDAFQKQLTIGYQDWMTRISGQIMMDTFGHQGLAVGDVNGDGLEDLYVAQTAGMPNLLFIQNPDGTASERGAAAGVDWLEPTRGALLVDLDNDGDQDLAMTLDDRLLIMANDGKGNFTRKAMMQLELIGYTLTAADVDSDGDLDLYAAVYFSPQTDPGKPAQPVPYFNATNGGRNSMWRNDATTGNEWKFTDVTDEWGLGMNNNRWSFAAAWEDYDSDGDLDLYVANDFGANNLYRNVGTAKQPKFVDVAFEAGVQDQSFGMSASWGDYNRDGRMDLYVANMFSSAGNRVTYQRKFRGGEDEKLRAKFQYLSRGNSLFENAGDGTFRDVSADAAVSMGRWAWSSLFYDINNDGWEDLLVANGYLTNHLMDDL